MNALLGGDYRFGHATYEDAGDALARAKDAVFADSDAMYTIRCDMADDMDGETAAENLDTLADASWMLAQLFEHDITVSQLFERNKAYPERITALRDLLRLTRETDQAITDRVEGRARELVEGIAR